MDQEKVGKFIKKLRKNNNLTQQELAEKLSVTYQAVSKWENGKSIPDISTLKLISELFNVNIEELLDGNKSKKKSFFNKKNIIIISIILILVVCILSFFAFLNKWETPIITPIPIAVIKVNTNPSFK